MTGDHRIELSANGKQQAYDAGIQLRDVLSEPESTLVYCSPYTRCRQTLGCIIESAYQYTNHGKRPNNLTIYEDARLREIEKGYHSLAEQEAVRERHGWFYYRYAAGESPADVCTVQHSIMYYITILLLLTERI